MLRIMVFLLIVALCGALDIGLHIAGGDLMPMPSAFSPLVDHFGFSTVAAVWVSLAFIGMRLVFLFWARRMAGSGRAKGCATGWHLRW